MAAAAAAGAAAAGAAAAGAASVSAGLQPPQLFHHQITNISSCLQQQFSTLHSSYY